MSALYNPTFEPVVERFRRFWRQDDKTTIICQINIREGELPRDAFMRFVPDVARMFEDYVHFFATRKRVADDTLPIVSPNFGAGFDASCYGTPVAYGHGTSYATPIMRDVTDLDSVDWTMDGDQLRFALDAITYYREHSDERVISGLIPILNPMDTAFSLLGTGLFYELCDRPDAVHVLLGRILDKYLRQEELRQQVAGFDGNGVFQGWMNWWAPGRTVCIGDDQLYSSNREFYEEFGLPYHQRIIDHFGSGWYHLHTSGLHLLPEIAKLKRLICLEISDDPNTSSCSLDVLPEVRRTLGNVPVKVAIRPNEFKVRLADGTLMGNVIYNVCEKDYGDIWDMSIDEANELAVRASGYRGPNVEAIALDTEGE